MSKPILSSVVTATAFMAGAAAAQEDVTVAYFLEWPTANMIAQAEDTYDQEMGAEVEWRAFGNGNEMSQAMASGSVDIAYSQGLIPFIVAVSSGLPIKVVGVAVDYAEADNCIVSRDSGITQENAEELEGKSVATPIGNVTHYRLLKMLDHLGVDPSAVNMVQMDGPDAAVALGRGDVVMGCGFGGALLRMAEYGEPLMTAEEQEAIGVRVFDLTTTTDGFIAEHPDSPADLPQGDRRGEREVRRRPGALPRDDREGVGHGPRRDDPDARHVRLPPGG